MYEATPSLAQPDSFSASLIIRNSCGRLFVLFPQRKQNTKFQIIAEAPKEFGMEDCIKT